MLLVLNIFVIMAQEIERKFLVDGEFKSQAFAQSRIIQGYISSKPGRTVRVRIRDDKGFLTIKGKTGDAGLSRHEWEQEISVTDAPDLMKLCEQGMLDNIRYLWRAGCLLFELVDVVGVDDGVIIV